MLIALASGLTCLVSAGCVAPGFHAPPSWSPAAEPSQGMRLAFPGVFGTGALNDPSPGLAVTLAPSDTGSEVLLGQPGPGPVVTVTAAEGARLSGDAFRLTGNGGVGTGLSQAGLAWNSSPALARVAAELAAQRYGAPQEAGRDMTLGLSIEAPSARTGFGFDVSLAPRIAVREEGDLITRRLGGELRLGQRFEAGLDRSQPEGWYMFVGADGEALVWDAGTELSGLFDLSLTDQVTVGDLQAGISLQRGSGELSFSYIRREMRYSDRNGSFEDNLDFAGVSFTMRR